ncbi:MAG: zinc ribbon domain-containing protein [Planctomycetes bacterium]|nr:zinc ribbon domain-containing protein [Planctomycetota bacterium]
MPIYEYLCRRCRDEFELLVRGSERPACPRCGGGELDKLLSVPAAHVAQKAALPVCHPSGSGCGRCDLRDGPCGL